MSDIEKLSESHLAVINPAIMESVKRFEDAVREKHKRVSEKKTNPNHVKQKAGMDYVEFNYMKNEASREYPLWSFKNLHIVKEMITLGWIVVQGELHFIDEGIPRVGAVAAAHRVQFKSDMPRTPENIVDLGNDVKAAVTDALKKAFNVYMNISDDIYRMIEIEDISNDQKQLLYNLIEETPPSEQAKFYRFVDGSVTKANFEETAIKLLKVVHKHLPEEEKGEGNTSIIDVFKDKFRKFGIDI